MRAVGLRIMPIAMLGYFIASLDRINVGFAALQMNKAIHLGPAAFGFGAGVFFVAYSFFAVPGSIFVKRIGVRQGIGLILIAWGAVSALTAFIQGPISFYMMRFLLGMTEAAFFPAIILYLSVWLPARHRGRLLSVMMIGLPLASIFGSPISAWLLSMNRQLGLEGWQWLFIIEGAPAVLLGLMTQFLLPAAPSSSIWLRDDQRQWLEDKIAQERNAATAPKPPSTWRTLVDRRVLALAMVNIGAIAVTNGLAIWQPQIIKSFSFTNMQTGLLNAGSFAIGTVFMYIWGWNSDRKRERRIHTALPLGLGCLALAASALTSSVWPTVLVLCMAITATSAIKGPFWALATELIPAEASAVAFGQITSLTNIGAFIGTYGVGLILSATGKYTYAMLPLMAIVALAFLCALSIARPARKPD